MNDQPPIEPIEVVAATQTPIVEQAPATRVAEIEARLKAIEQHVERWLGNSAAMVKAHIAEIRKLL